MQIVKVNTKSPQKMSKVRLLFHALYYAHMYTICHYMCNENISIGSVIGIGHLVNYSIRLLSINASQMYVQYMHAYIHYTV